MSKPKIINVTFIDPYESNDSQDPDYIPSQTPESEDYISYESSSLETSSVYMGILAQPFYPIFPHFSKLGPLFKSS